MGFRFLNGLESLRGAAGQPPERLLHSVGQQAVRDWARERFGAEQYDAQSGRMAHDVARNPEVVAKALLVRELVEDGSPQLEPFPSTHESYAYLHALWSSLAELEPLADGTRLTLYNVVGLRNWYVEKQPPGRPAESWIVPMDILEDFDWEVKHLSRSRWVTQVHELVPTAQGEVEKTLLGSGWTTLGDTMQEDRIGDQMGPADPGQRMKDTVVYLGSVTVSFKS